MPDIILVGNVQLIGVGSVGSAIAYLLRMLPLEGEVTIIDHDLIEIENLNRSPLFGISDVGKPKVSVVDQYLNNHITVNAFQGQYSEFIKSHGRKPGSIDILIPEANEYNVRFDMENNYPPIQIYGTTSTSWGINYHRHVPLSQDDCSVCHFPASTTQPNFICSEAQVEIQDEKPIDAALPFLSVGAAALVVADLIKLQLPGYPFTSNFAYIDFLGKLENIVSYDRRSKEDCPCRTRSVNIHKKYISSTRFYRKLLI
jgi:predicted CXXCH cytochrome family protein